MVYKVLFTARAQNDLNSILNNDLDHYSPVQSLKYVQDLCQKCEGLDIYPKRSTALDIHGREYWRLTYKAHAVYYRVDEGKKQVYIIAILGGPQLPEKHVI